jgi:hypothetical protein
MRHTLPFLLTALLTACAGPPEDTSGGPDAGVVADAAADAAPTQDAGADAADASAPPAYPRVTELEDSEEPPDLFTSFDGSRAAQTQEEWRAWRRAELLDLFDHYVYGYAPTREVTVTAREVASAPILEGAGRYTEYELTLGDLPTTIHLALFTPAGVDAPPVFLGLNKCGNQAALEDAAVRATTSWFDVLGCGGEDVEQTRGHRASYWPVAEILGRGYALATFHEADVDPDTNDDGDFSDGVHPHLAPEGRAAEVAWGRISAWSWGMSRAIDFLSTQAPVDASRIATVGHSRRGKTSLLTGARDERVALVIAHQSGTAGTALTRHLEGEPLFAINALFPHWFNEVFPTFARSPLRVPVDQHQLIALVAPRLMLATDGDADDWADPVGSRMAVRAASPAWALHGVDGVVDGGDGAPSLRGRLSWRLRPGGHDMGPTDWGVFMDFADAHWSPR